LHFRTATLLESFSDLPGALEEYRQAAHHAPTNATYAFREGAAAIQQGAYGQAEEALGRAIALNPGSAPAHKALGVLLVDVLGRRDEGLPHLRKALELDPGIKDHERMQKIVDASR